MKALILAAGLGTRLKPLTNEMPKCMVKVNGKRIIDKQIENLVSNNISEIIIITGYKNDILENYINEKFKNVDISFITNEEYKATNNMYSLYLAKDKLFGNEFIMMNADVYFDENIIKEIIEEKVSSLIVCEKDIFYEESMKILLDKDGNVFEISKQISRDKSYAVSIDVYKFGRNVSKRLFEIVDEYINVKKEVNSWSEVAINEVVKLEKVKPLTIQGRWFEIDSIEDLKIAEEIFK